MLGQVPGQMLGQMLGLPQQEQQMPGPWFSAVSQEPEQRILESVRTHP
jgi:hypothetical protein